MSQVTNYDVENAAGNVVRADINNILDAIKTNNSGGSEPLSPVKFMLYGKSSDNKLKVYDGSNFRTIGDVEEDNLGLLPRAGGTMTGVIYADDASGANAPALSFDGDADTGIYRKSANTVAFSTAGSERAFINNSGVTIQAQGDIRLADSDSSNWVALQAASTIGSNITFTLPSSDGSNGQIIQTNGSGVLSFSTVNGVPSGAVFCLAVGTVPSGYLECDGSAVSRTTYAALFAVISTTYGSTSGSNFRVPDLRGEFVRGWDHGRGVDSGRSINSTTQSDQNESHTHAKGTLSGSTNSQGNHFHEYVHPQSGSPFGYSSTNYQYHLRADDNGPQPYGKTSTTGNHTHTVTISGTTGSRGGTEARPRNIAMMYIIKT